MKKQRLLKLADLLEKDANNSKGMKFDLGNWVAPANLKGKSLGKKDYAVNCGTVGCAIGLACLSGAFKRQGLSLVFEETLTGGIFIEPTFDGQHGFRAAEQFFGLDEEEAGFLFYEYGYTPTQRKGKRGELAVAKRIRDFVAGEVSP